MKKKTPVPEILMRICSYLEKQQEKHKEIEDFLTPHQISKETGLNSQTVKKYLRILEKITSKGRIIQVGKGEGGKTYWKLTRYN